MTQDHNDSDTLHQISGELDMLEHMYYGSTEGTAGDWGNLGLLYQTRGNLDKAEQFYRQALEQHEATGCQEGMAADYCNLGLLYQLRGKLEQTAVFWKKSLHLYRTTGHPNAAVIEQLLCQLTYV